MNRAWLRQMVLLWAGRLVKWTTLSGLGSRECDGTVTMPPYDPAESEESSTQPVRIYQHFGYRCAPVSGSEVVVVAPRADPCNAVVVASDSRGHGPTGLSEGDAAMYSSAHKEGQVCVIRLYATGKITIDAKEGQDVVVNGGTLKVARDTDPVKVHGAKAVVGTFAHWLEQVRLQIIAGGGGNVGDPPDQIGTINVTAATRFKG